MSVRAGIALRTPRVPARPPSADRPGIAERELGATLPTARTALPDFRGPACDALRAVKLYGISKLRLDF